MAAFHEKCHVKPCLFSCSVSVKFHFVAPKLPALLGAPLISKEALLAGSDLLATPTLPVVVFCHGLGGMRTTNSAVCCDLASHGFLVASIEHR